MRTGTVPPADCKTILASALLPSSVKRDIQLPTRMPRACPINASTAKHDTAKVRVQAACGTPGATHVGHIDRGLQTKQSSSSPQTQRTGSPLVFATGASDTTSRAADPCSYPTCNNSPTASEVKKWAKRARRTCATSDRLPTTSRTYRFVGCCN